jgi:beta-lactamase regulating signal transducer with metallopeptidase domain
MSEVNAALLQANLAASALIALVVILRAPLRKAFGSAVVYGLWAAPVLAALVTLLPIAPPAGPSIVFSASSWSGFGGVMSAGVLGERPGDPAVLITAIWIAGAFVSAALVAIRHAQFLRIEARGQAGPGVMGGLWPRLVLPADFATRFTADERRMILAHERAHLARLDAQAMALVATIRCLCWFNPLVHLAAALVREDQEYACDETVLAQGAATPRGYAEALLRAQISSRLPPLGCQWPLRSIHSLEKRVVMLERKPVFAKAHVVGCALVLAVAVGGGYAAWATDAAPLREQPVQERAAAGLTFRVVDEAGQGGVREGAKGPDGAVLWFKPAAGPTAKMVGSAKVVSANGAPPRIDFTLTPDGTRAFAALTRDNVGKRIAILIDGQVVSAPVVREAITGGKGQISGAFTEAEARDLAERITAAAR